MGFASLVTRTQVMQDGKSDFSSEVTLSILHRNFDIFFSPANCCRNATPLRSHYMLHKQNVLPHKLSVRYLASLFFLAIFKYNRACFRFR